MPTTTPRYLNLKRFRQKWGDSKHPDMLLPETPIEQTMKEASDILLSSFKQASNVSRKPHTAELVDHAGKVVARLQVRQVAGAGVQTAQVTILPITP